MSLKIIQSKLFTLRPSIRETKKSIVIKTGFLTKLFTFFLYMQKVEIIPSLRKVQISKTFFWSFIFRKQLDFDDVWYIDYSYNSMTTQFGWTSSRFGAQDEVESYSISIVTKDEKFYSICSFRGEGACCTGWDGVLLGGDEALDYKGTQESESRQFADYISKIFGVPFGKPIPESIDMKTCPECDRETSPYNPKCLYCGAKLTE